VVKPENDGGQPGRRGWGGHAEGQQRGRGATYSGMRPNGSGATSYRGGPPLCIPALGARRATPPAQAAAPPGPLRSEGRFHEARQGRSSHETPPVLCPKRIVILSLPKP
jgi:hypothetical protein